MKSKKKFKKGKKYARKTVAKKQVKVIKEGYYDKFDEKPYSGPEIDVNVKLKRKATILKHLESDVVKQNDDELPLEHIADEEESLSEDPRSTEEGLGIEEEEKAGQEAYPEIEKAEKDPDEEEEE